MLGVIIALALGVSGLLYLLVALWILLTGHAPRASLTPGWRDRTRPGCVDGLCGNARHYPRAESPAS